MGPHKPWSDQRHSALTLARVRHCLTLKDLANASALSLSQIHRMEQRGAGSDAAWAAVARALDERVDRLRPRTADSRQLALFAEVR